VDRPVYLQHVQGWEQHALAKKSRLVGHQSGRLHDPITLLLQALQLVTNVYNLWTM
jgi:hypothetical protein